MAIAFRKPGGSITAPAGQALVIVSVPVTDLQGAANKKLRAVQLAVEQLKSAETAEAYTDAELDAQVQAFAASIAAVKAMRGSGGID